METVDVMLVEDEIEVVNLTPRVNQRDFELLRVLGKGAFGKVRHPCPCPYPLLLLLESFSGCCRAWMDRSIDWFF